jgi:hypothetical protein
MRIYRARLAMGTALAASLALTSLGAGPAGANHRNVTAVKGSAYGYHADVTIFGSHGVTGPAPSVTLAADASNTPVSASAPSGSAKVGTATFFTSGQLTVNTSGSLGPNGTASASTTISNVNTSQTEWLTAARLASSCTSNGAGLSGSTTITGGTLMVDNGYDSNGDGDFTDSGEHPPVTVSLSANPSPGTTLDIHVHLSPSATDNYQFVFNEQIINPDGSLTVYAAHQRLLGPTAVGNVWIGKSECGLTQVIGKHGASPNFDGDSDTDRSVFRNGAWFAQGQTTAFLGQAGDIPVPADYDGDGDTDRAVYRNGAWFIEGRATVFHGLATDIPVPGDYDGDGDVEPAVFRPSIGGWYILGQATVFLGLSTDIPVPARYDADTDTDPAVWRPSVGGWYVAGQTTQFLGLMGDIPVPGDYDATGVIERAIWRPGVGGWYVEGQAAAFVGLNSDRPVPGDYDGDGDTDRGVWRPAVGGWYVQNQATVFLGATGDIPLPLPNAVYRKFF